MTTVPGADCVCATSRLLPFKPSRVFQAFANADSLATWWGPDGFTNTFDIFEFAPQGRWTFTMHGPDGSHYPNENRFLETSPDNIVIQHLSSPHFTLTVALAEQDGQTLLTWHQCFEDPKFAQVMRHIIEPANEQNLNRLHNLLASAATH